MNVRDKLRNTIDEFLGKDVPPDPQRPNPQRPNVTAYLLVKVCEKCGMWWPISRMFPLRPDDLCGVCKLPLVKCELQIAGKK